MSDNIIDFKKKKKVVTKLDYKSLKSASKPPQKRSAQEIRELNEKTVKKLITELEETLQEFFKYDNSSNAYIAKIRGDFAVRINFYKLDKEIYKYFFKKGLFFDFKLVRIDDWNVYGKVTLLWDMDYSKFFNRLSRKISLLFRIPAVRIPGKL